MLGLAILGQLRVGVKGVGPELRRGGIKRLVVGSLGELEPFAIVPGC